MLYPTVDHMAQLKEALKSTAIPNVAAAITEVEERRRRESWVGADQNKILSDLKKLLIKEKLHVMKKELIDVQYKEAVANLDTDPTWHYVASLYAPEAKVNSPMYTEYTLVFVGRGRQKHPGKGHCMLAGLSTRLRPHLRAFTSCF